MKIFKKVTLYLIFGITFDLCSYAGKNDWLFYIPATILLALDFGLMDLWFEEKK